MIKLHHWSSVRIDSQSKTYNCLASLPSTCACTCEPRVEHSQKQTVRPGLQYVSKVKIGRQAKDTVINWCCYCTGFWLLNSKRGKWWMGLLLANCFNVSNSWWKIGASCNSPVLFRVCRWSIFNLRNSILMDLEVPLRVATADTDILLSTPKTYVIKQFTSCVLQFLYSKLIRIELDNSWKDT